jgi:Fic family protein
MPRRDIAADIMAYLQAQQAVGQPECSAEAIATGITAPRPTVNRHLAKMAGQQIRKLYSGPATRYALQAATPEPAPLVSGFQFSSVCQPILAQLAAPIGTRQPVTYQRGFLEGYQPNQSSLLPPALATELYEAGRSRDQQPAGTYARKVLEQLLIDLSWHSSRLEGNRKSLLDTQELFARGHAEASDIDALMLLNHKAAIEFVVEDVPHYGLTAAVVRNLHAILMQGLLPNSEALGRVREKVVNITDSVYLPLQLPQLLEELLGHLIATARQIKNPVEAAFFLWVNLAYLQPFEDGNKRTSRLCANVPLLLQNCAPLSFLDVEPPDYAQAMLGVYERKDVALAVELFAWTYRRSIQKYAVILEAMGAPDPFRQRYREHLGEAMRRVVAERAAPEVVVSMLNIPSEDVPSFSNLVREELRNLEVYNCARYRLSLSATESWIEAGRPAAIAGRLKPVSGSEVV